MDFSTLLSYIGMILILVAFVLETRGVLNSKQGKYLALMALGSGLLAIRAYIISEWAFLLLELVWCFAALLAMMKMPKAGEKAV